jgi:hypothetical protein
MNKLYSGLAAAALLTLAACGSGDTGSANGVDEVNVSTDNLTATDTLDANALGTDNNVLGADANLTNGADLNVVDTGNTADANAAGNATANGQ